MPSERDARSLPIGTLTFLFTDIEGSTRILTMLGDRYAGLLERHGAVIRSAISTHSGTEVSTEGDSFFAVFPSAIDAVGAAVTAQRELAQARWPKGATIRVRMGMHTGEGRLGSDGYVGLDIHRAARIAAAGHGGQVLVSDTTRALVEASLSGEVGLLDLGQHRLKDFDRPIRISQLEIAGLSSNFPALKTLDARSGNLPNQLTSFIGRQRELPAVAQLAASHRLVTLTGPGGTGKTRLALRVADELIKDHADGAFFVDLAAVRDAALVPLATARALGVIVDPGGDALVALRAHLRDRELLLILDNFEQVIEAAETVEQLLAAAPRLRVLVTSREALAIYGEQEFPVAPFAVDDASASDAMALFVDRARALKPGLDLSDAHAKAIAGIVGRLDGLPLAIELAAGQVRVLTPESILSNLDRRLPLLASATRGRPERQRTMRAAIEWSYDLLGEPQRRLFARLSVFPAGCSLEGAAAVGGLDDLDRPLLDGIASLVGSSLIRQSEGPDGDSRFSMLETIREYAGERLRADFDADAASRRMAGFFVAFAEDAESHLTAEDQARWLNRCARESANIRQAVDWATDATEAETGLRIATALWRFWQQRGPLWEGRRMLDRLLALPDAAANTRARALGAAGGLAWWDGDQEATRRLSEEALRLIEAGGDSRDEVEARYNLGFALLWSAVLGGSMDAERADELFQQSRTMAQELGDLKSVAKAHRGIGQVMAIARRDPAGAIPIFEKSVSLLAEVGDRWEMIESLVALGNGHRYSGDKERGRAFYLQAVDLAAEAGNRQTTTGLLFLLAALEGEMGHHERVAALWGAAEAAKEATGALRPPAAQRLIGDPVGAARAAIGDKTVERALAAGGAMDHDAAVAYAHET